MKSLIVFLRSASIFLCLLRITDQDLIAQTLASSWDRPFIFRVDSLSTNSVILPISLPRATFIFDSTGREMAGNIPIPYQKRWRMSICYQIATDSLFTRDVAGTAVTDSLTKTIGCFDLLDYFISILRPLPAEIIHIDSAFTARIRIRNLKPNTQYFARACTRCLRYGGPAGNDVAFNSFPSNTIKFTTLRETSVREEVVDGAAFALEQNIPNPFNDETSIGFTLPEASEVSLSVYDTFGRMVMEIAKGRMNAGQHRYMVLMNTLPPGVYSYRLVAHGRILSRQMLYIR